jgi:aquaporin Z
MFRLKSLLRLPARLVAEMVGTCWLVLGGCGTAVLAGPDVGVPGIALAFGLTVVTMAYAIGHVSGCHLNPAVTLGLVVAGRFPRRDLLLYWIAQVTGAALGAWAIYAIAVGKPGFDAGAFASNGFDALSPGKYSLWACFLCEVVCTFFFLLVIIGTTHVKAPAALAGLAIGLCLTLIHLFSIPVTNTSVNPARSTGVAFFATTGALGQLWLFWVAPLVGAALAGLVWPILDREDPAPSDEPPSAA